MPFEGRGISVIVTRSILAVEMEAASLYAFADARRKAVVCFAHITNQMGEIESDFEKGEADGSLVSLEVISTVARHWSSWFGKEDRVEEEGLS